MCLIVFNWQPNSLHSLIVASNRDEFYARKSLSAHFWQDSPNIYAGRDIEKMGTWLGVSTNYRLAAVTNFRAPDDKVYAKSRGQIPQHFLSTDVSAQDFASNLSHDKQHYPGYNALLYDGSELVYTSNRDPESDWRTLKPGLYGLSNHLLDTAWPKVKTAKSKIGEYFRNLSHKQLYDQFTGIFQDDSLAPDEELPETGVAPELEKMLSAIFIRSPNYGTRTSTLVTMHQDKSMEVSECNHSTPYQSASTSYQHITPN